MKHRGRKELARWVDAVRAGDIATVRTMLEARPELVYMDMAWNNEHRALHYAVLDRRSEIVRVVMQHGADARKGIYPHREATSAITLAVERGYDDIVAIIEEEERRRDSQRGIAPADSREDTDGPLTQTVKQDRPELLAQLLDAGVDPDERTRVEGLDEPTVTWGMPLWHCAATGNAGPILAEQLLWGAACGGDPEIVRMALERIDWPRDDPRWFRVLEQPLRLWNHGPWPWANPAWDRGTYVAVLGRDR